MTSPKPARLVAVVVTHNRLEPLKTCLSALHVVAELDALVVVDNASTDGTAEWLAGLEDARIRVVRSSENIGGAGGFALGMSFAQQEFNPDWVVLMDDDAWPEPSALRCFLDEERSAIALYAAAVFDEDGAISALNRVFWNPFTSVSVFLKALIFGKSGYYLGPKEYQSDQTKSVDFATFVGLFIPRACLNIVDPPDRRLFLYCDDLDYCHRARAAGFSLIFDPRIRFTHACSTFIRRSRIYTPLWKSYYGHRNELLIIRKTAQMLTVPVSLGLVTLWALRSVFYGREAPSYLRLLWLAMKDAYRQDFSRSHPDILRLAARGIGCVKTNNASPNAPRKSPVSTGNKTSA